MALKAYIWIEIKKDIKISSLSSHLRISKKEEQIKVYRRKENMKIIAEIIRKNNSNKNWFFEKISRQ